MKKLLLITAISILIMAFRTAVTDGDKSREMQEAVNKSLALLQQSSHTFLANAGGCHSCHGQGLGGVAFTLAKENGYQVKDEIVKEAVDSICSSWKGRVAYLNQNSDPVAIIMTGSYDLWALSATHTPKTKNMQELALNIMRRQHRNGNWVSPNLRPPLEYYSFTATALAIKNCQEFIPPIFKDEVNRRVQKGREWLMTTIPETNEERVFQLLGLTWSHAGAAFVRQQAEKLLATQRKDGGWTQLDSLASDAYATGQSLYALNQCGYVTAAAPAFRAGIDFLLRTQYADGSWKVKTRSFPSVNFVESGFPHGDDQFISAAGANWATMALVLASRSGTQ